MNRLLNMVAILALACPVLAGDLPIMRAKERVQGEYIVVLKPGGPAVKSAADALEKMFGARVNAHYESSFQGFWMQATEDQALAISRHPLVHHVEENAVIRLAGSQVMFPHPDTTNVPSRWYLDRIDQQSQYASRLNGAYEWCSDGSGTRIYVIDTGVRPDHPEFVGRLDVTLSQSWINYANSHGGLINEYVGLPCWETSNWNAAGAHGTSVASIAAGSTFGVAKGATIVDVRAFLCAHGSSRSNVLIKAMDWIRDEAPLEQSVVNFSFSTPYWLESDYSSLQQALNSLAQAVPVFSAAGNANANSFWYWPGNSPYDITMAGMNKLSDSRWQYSNYGGVDFYAPAQFIESASHYYNGQRWVSRSELSDCFNSLIYPADGCVSGTSFAAPQGAGAAARYLQFNPTATPSQVKTFLQSRAITATVTQPDGSTRPVLNMTSQQCP